MSYQSNIEVIQQKNFKIAFALPKISETRQNAQKLEFISAPFFSSIPFMKF